VSAEEVGALVDAVLADALRGGGGWVLEMATLEVRTGEPGILAAAGERGWRLVGVSGAELGQARVPNPSRKVKELVGAGSVAEAAALVRAGAHGRAAELVVAKRRSPRATAAVARVKIECPSRSWLERDYAGRVRRRVRRSGEELRP
jgi:cobalt-precorrin 5A hydrolase/precorrin-3B C17-methyltransferase